jgi:hypothetical protein
METLEERLKRLKSVNASDVGGTEARGPAPKPSSPQPKTAAGGPKRELSDKAANLIATTLKDFLRS